MRPPAGPVPPAARVSPGRPRPPGGSLRAAHRLGLVARGAATVGPALLVVLLGLVTAGGFRRLQESRAWVGHTREVLRATEATLRHLTEAETGQRGYLLTGEPRHLAPYRRAVAAVTTDTATLRHLTRDNPAQQRRLDALAPPIAAKIAELAATIRLHETGGFEAALAVVRTERGAAQMEAIRRVLGAVEAEEERLLRERIAAEHGAARLVTGVFVGGTLAAVLVALLVNALLTRAQARQVALAEELATSNDQLQDQAAELELQQRELEDQAVELEATNDDLRQTAAALEARSEAEMQARAEAEAARAAAEAANLAKSDFLAVMSHELRTPINAIVDYTELMELGLSGPITDAQRQQLGRVRASSGHLLGLVNEVLDLAKIEAGQLTVRRRPARAAAATDAALALIRPQAAARRLTISARRHGEPDAVYVGDEDRVRQIVANLLANAVKFTEPGGHIDLEVGTTTQPAADGPPADGESGSGAATARWTYLRVRDTGIGIAPEQLARVFEPFVQVESGLTRARGGTGLGLAISRRLARLMGGDLTAQSRPGEGSTFTLWLPAGSPPAVSVRPVPLPATHVAVGEALAASLTTIVSTFVDRVRADPAIPVARDAASADLEDHVATFVTDLAQSFIILDEGGADRCPLIRDGAAIQQLVADKHGAQRRRLGWTTEAIRREFTVLRGEIEDALRAATATTADAPVEEALALLGLFLAEAEAISLRGWREAGEGEEGGGAATRWRPAPSHR